MKKTFVAAFALAATLPAHAALTTVTGADIYTPSAFAGYSIVADFENFDGLETTGPEAIAPGVTFTGDNGSILGANIAELGPNGIWGAGNFFAAGSYGELRFTFATLTQSAGALVNFYPFNPPPELEYITMSAYGENNQIIETHKFMISTPSDSLNMGTFAAITRDSADIKSISFKGFSVVVDNVSVVPEPGTYAMLLAGLGLIGMIARRRM
ncbi:MAG: PEP-CTERM sorting domain-containing protein [Methyloversatilis sp.]|nr:PEP-CTERM sorting domain-containing protein [Methyloversatilis sp.]MBP6193988.1 PEP-CTERM sorting domain-containing protein [Methyloversatilis sp.]MBP9116893.1 PEP-CTERM sorting domain-containing protein [Methyloversatilis sp.]